MTQELHGRWKRNDHLDGARRRSPTDTGASARRVPIRPFSSAPDVPRGKVARLPRPGFTPRCRCPAHGDRRSDRPFTHARNGVDSFARGSGRAFGITAAWCHFHNRTVESTRLKEVFQRDAAALNLPWALIIAAVSTCRSMALCRERSRWRESQTAAARMPPRPSENRRQPYR